MSPTTDPMTSPAPAEVPLPSAPLVRVVAQVRFPQVLSVEKREFVAPFQEAIRSRYPVLRPEHTQALVLGPLGASPVPPQTVWRFADAEGNWRVSLAPDFAAIETTAYTSRKDFLERFEAVVRALAEHVSPGVTDRIGVRYIDRVTGPALSDLARLVAPAALGVVATTTINHARHSVTETLFTVPGSPAHLLARWGLLPAGGTVDRAAIEPIDEPSWILDLDMFRRESQPFDVTDVVAAAAAYAERIYAFFRWVVTDHFLRLYGGTP